MESYIGVRNMSNINDSKILKLKEQIKSKKEKLNKIKKFSPITNCILDLDGQKYNIQVLNRQQVISLLIKLNCYKSSAEELELLDDYEINGYKLNDWIEDLKSKLDILSVREEESKLKQMELKLDRLLSEDKKVELELSEIESMLSE